MPDSFPMTPRGNLTNQQPIDGGLSDGTTTLGSAGATRSPKPQGIHSLMGQPVAVDAVRNLVAPVGRCRATNARSSALSGRPLSAVTTGATMIELSSPQRDQLPEVRSRFRHRGLGGRESGGPAIPVGHRDPRPGSGARPAGVLAHGLLSAGWGGFALAGGLVAGNEVRVTCHSATRSRRCRFDFWGGSTSARQKGCHRAIS